MEKAQRIRLPGRGENCRWRAEQKRVRHIAAALVIAGVGLLSQPGYLAGASPVPGDHLVLTKTAQITFESESSMMVRAEGGPVTDYTFTPNLSITAGSGLEISFLGAGEMRIREIDCAGGLTVLGKNNAALVVENNQGGAITVKGGDFKVDDASLRVSAKEEGVSVTNGRLLVTGNADIEVKQAGANGIYAQKGIAVGAGSTVSAVSAKAAGIRTDQALEVQGGSVHGQGAGSGIKAGAVTASGGSITAEAASQGVEAGSISLQAQALLREVVQGERAIGGENYTKPYTGSNMADSSRYSWDLSGVQGTLDWNDKGELRITGTSAGGSGVLMAQRGETAAQEPVSLTGGARHIIVLRVKVEAAPPTPDPGEPDDKDGEDGEDGDGDGTGGGGQPPGGGETPGGGEEENPGGGQSPGPGDGDANGTGGEETPGAGDGDSTGTGQGSGNATGGFVTGAGGGGFRSSGERSDPQDTDSPSAAPKKEDPGEAGLSAFIEMPDSFHPGNLPQTGAALPGFAGKAKK